MERLSVDYGKKSKLEFSVYPAPQVGDRRFIYLVILVMNKREWDISKSSKFHLTKRSLAKI